MQFHIQEMMSKNLQSTIEKQQDVSKLFQDRRDVLETGPLHVSLTVTGYEQFIVVEGQLTIDVTMACSRCLEPAREDVTIPFMEKFKPVEVMTEEDEEEEESDFIEITNDKLDLLPYLEESLLLFLPFAPLCNNDCKGLCQHCGQNLNEGSCTCKADHIDPRFEALKDFFKQ
ncbi:YceD family protein [Paenibacillus yanchengensis]|uniref:YceD family protein n=1 Tax=Paenibacillus yanchengensis TaxID=2035833 RepID=A0ABW4YMA3_9BACL